MCASALVEPDLSSEDERAIRDIVRGLERAWNGGDGEHFAAAFAEHAQSVLADGTVHDGRVSIAGALHEVLTQVYPRSYAGYTIEYVRLVHPRIALVRVRTHIRYLREGSLRSLHERYTLVLRTPTEDGGVWQIVLWHATAEA